MSLESVRAFFAEKAPDITVIESPISSATVPLATISTTRSPIRKLSVFAIRAGSTP